MRMSGPEQALAQLVPEEARLARDRHAVDGAGEMADERAGNPPVEDHRHLSGRSLARIEPLDRALARAAPDPFGRIEIGSVKRGRIVVVPLHRGALAGDGRHRHGVTRSEIGATKAMAGGEHHAAHAGGGGRAVRLGHALDRKCRCLGLLSALLQHGDRRQFGIEEIEIGLRASRVASDRQGRHRRPPARPWPWPPRARRAASHLAAMSLVDTTACRRPTSTRRPTSSLSERSEYSTAPSRTSTESETERTATASAASAPARRAAVTRRSARSVSADWSSSDAIAGIPVVRGARFRQVERARQGPVKHEINGPL